VNAVKLKYPKTKKSKKNSLPIKRKSN